MDSAELGFNLRKEFGDWNDGCEEPKVENQWGNYGDYQLVGNGSVTNISCGRWLGFRGCTRVELHNLVTLEGVNYKNKAFVRKVHVSCDKPSCPICYEHGWAVREAKNIEARLKECSKRFGQVEHIIVSCPHSDYGLSLESLRLKAVKVMKARSIAGGTLIFHAFRYRSREVLLKGVWNSRGWYFSPHFHVLGYILGGYGKCRSCQFLNDGTFAECRGCVGFEGRTRRCFDEDGYIVKVKGERKTVFGTAWYQLNHASIKRDAKRFHVATWFGVCSYRKLKVMPEIRKSVCPICGHDLERLRYSGNKSFVCDRSAVDYKQDTFEDLFEDGVVVWCAVPSERYGSDSYEF